MRPRAVLTAITKRNAAGENSMTREFIESLIPETVEGRAAIVDGIIKEAGKDITREQKKFSDYDTLKTDLASAQTTIAELKAALGDAEALKTKIAEYETKEAQRVEQEAKAAKQRELAQRFTAVRGTVEFIDPDIEAFVLSKFGAAVEDPANKGKGDAELYTALTKDKPFFKSQNPPAPNMGGTGAVLGVDAVAAMRTQYEAAVKAGNTPVAVSLKNQLFELEKKKG